MRRVGYRRSGATALGLGALLLGLVGCDVSPGTLTGKVTYQGKPVVCGVVTVVGRDGIPRVGNIEPDGTYSVFNVPQGSVKIGVESPEPPDPNAPTRPGGERGGDDKPTGPTLDRTKWFQLPAQFADPNKSGQSTTIQPGPNPFDITLQ